MTHPTDRQGAPVTSDLDRPLAGVEIVSIALNVPGPVAVRRLQDLGASVTTVLPPAGDPLEQYSPPWFIALHAGQQVLTLDLKTETGAARMTELLDAADLFVTSSRPSALRRLGVDFETLSQRHPRLGQIDIVGHPGPDAEIAGHDLTYEAVEGLVRPPGLPTTFVADLSGAERAVSEALVALRVRDTTGRGCRREVALAQTAHDFAAPARYGLTASTAHLGGGYPAYSLYRAADGWIALAALEPHFLSRTLELLDVDGSAESYAAVFATRAAAEWEAWATEHDVPLVAVREPGGVTGP
ncbi:CoA transferase [Mobilicoccus massiliensis]|uniref:CoA transferase n=1 Tax=Mobilicoccus massiliensis TaxID=1522310 RepID=UPI000693D58B|nr:CoA transferase [Mobilicoccus massiliensis]